MPPWERWPYQNISVNYTRALHNTDITMKRLFFLFSVILFFCFNVHDIAACTTGLAGPEATSNSHVILWKNRDSGFNNNELAFFRNGDFRYMGIINTNDTSQIWAGVNNYGFAIMNAESRDMAAPGENTGYDDEGYLMKAALQQCKNSADFEEMLKSTNSEGRKVTSNFGVIDALGNAVFFETGNHEYVRFDTKTSKESPYLIRANFAYEARSSEGYGYVRHNRAQALFKKSYHCHNLDHRYIISTVSGDIELPDSLIEKTNPVQRKTQDTVNRYRSVSASVFDSYGAGGSPELTTFWCSLGEPAVSISIPLWVRSGRVPLVLDSDSGSSLNKLFRDIKEVLYADQTHIDLVRLERSRKILDKGQKQIFRKTAKELKKWERALPEPDTIVAFQEKMLSIALRSVNKVLSNLQSENN